MSAPYFIKYTVKDLMIAQQCSVVMVDDAIKRHAVDRMGEDSTTSHYYGALSEIAVARVLHVSWKCHPHEWNKPDVGRYEVRGIGPRVKYPEVKTKKNDHDDVPIMSVLLISGAVTADVEMGIVLGWAWPQDIRDKGTFKDPGYRKAPAYFMDINSLNVIIPELENK